MSQEQQLKPEAAVEESPIMTKEEEPEAAVLGESITTSKEQEEHEPEAAVVDESTTMSEEQSATVNEEGKPVALGDELKASEEQPEPVSVPPSDIISKKNNEESPKSPVTYGDVFPAAAAEQGPLASEAITMEDAALMQTAEAMAFGHTLKGGAASAMQSAAARNVHDGLVAKDAHSRVSEYGLSVTETSVPGATMDIEYVAGQPVAASAHPTPTDPALAAVDAVTIGEALEAAAVGSGDRPVEDSDARAIASAERRATGVSMPMKGGIGATAQSAAQLNHNVEEESGKTTIADVLMDATGDLPMDKVVTYEDAYRVLQAELRGRDEKDLQPGGIGAMLAAAADMNEQSGLVPPSGFLADEGRTNFEGEEMEDDDVADNLPYQPLESKQSEDFTKQGESTKEETTPLVHNSDEQVSSHGSEKLPTPKQPESVVS